MNFLQCNEYVLGKERHCISTVTSLRDGYKEPLFSLEGEYVHYTCVATWKLPILYIGIFLSHSVFVSSILVTKKNNYFHYLCINYFTYSYVY